VRRPLLALVLALVGIGVLAGGLAWLLDLPKPSPNASRVERQWIALCATCHDVDGRGSWRATLFLIRPGDFTDPKCLQGVSDQALASIIKNGGASVGKPGMPAFGALLSDADLDALVAYVRSLGRR
jgi:mono/diheme cytochrome c family protein